MSSHSRSYGNQGCHAWNQYLILPGISSDGDREEFVNESATLESLGLAVPLLKLTERRGNQDEKLLNAEISNLIGKRLHEFDVMGAEVVHVEPNY